MNEFQSQIGSTCLSDEEKWSTNLVELNASVWYRGREGGRTVRVRCRSCGAHPIRNQKTDASYRNHFENRRQENGRTKRKIA